DNYLFIGYDNHIKVLANPKATPFTCGITNGKVTTLTDSTFVIKNLLPVTTLLSVYVKDKNGKPKLALNKPYAYVPFPTIKISGVKCDSAITRLMLAAGTFYAEFKNIGKFQVKSFKMDMYINKEFVQDSSSTGRLTKKMLEYISSSKSGSLLYFKDLKFGTADGVPKTEPIYRVFLIDDNKSALKFGF
ncbi:MAG: hypothetical protein ABIP51_07955, partial [Bacteroidia bacterium]